MWTLRRLPAEIPQIAILLSRKEEPIGEGSDQFGNVLFSILSSGKE